MAQQASKARLAGAMQERRKALENALRFNEEGVRHLANKLRVLRLTRQIAYGQFLDACKIANPVYRTKTTQFFKYLSAFVRCGNIGDPKTFKEHHSDLFSEDDYRAIIKALFEHKLWYPERLFEPVPAASAGPRADLRPPHLQHALLPDSVFHAVARFIGMDRDPNGVAHTGDTDELRAHFTGDYNVYRFSTIELGRLLVGRLTVAWDPDTHAIVTDEDYRIEELDRSFHLDGFLFGYDRRFRLLSRHSTSRQPQVIFIDNLQRDDRQKVHHMSGVAADIQDSGRLYVTRVAFSRIGGETKAEPIRTASIEEIPPHAKIKLTQKPTNLGDYILEF